MSSLKGVGMGRPRWQGKNVYITGGSSGIGLAAAQQFFSHGADVIIIARGEERLEAALKEIEPLKVSDSQRADRISLDVSDHAAVNEKIGRAVNEFGTPHVLINSAGFAYPNYFEKIPYDTFKETIDTNLCGIWNMCACLIPSMKSTGGHIVNISSIAGFIGIFGYTAYSASKFAVMGFSESLRGEMKPYNISVCVLCPPDTDTPQLAEENRTKPAETRAIAGNAGLMSPKAVAKDMIKGMEQGKFIIIPGMQGKFIHLAQRLFPGLVRIILDAQIKKVRNATKRT